MEGGMGRKRKTTSRERIKLCTKRQAPMGSKPMGAYFLCKTILKELIMRKQKKDPFVDEIFKAIDQIVDIEEKTKSGKEISPEEIQEILKISENLIKGFMIFWSKCKAYEETIIEVQNHVNTWELKNADRYRPPFHGKHSYMGKR